MTCIERRSHILNEQFSEQLKIHKERRHVQQSFIVMKKFNNIISNEPIQLLNTCNVIRILVIFGFTTDWHRLFIYLTDSVFHVSIENKKKKTLLLLTLPELTFSSIFFFIFRHESFRLVVLNLFALS